MKKIAISVLAAAGAALLSSNPAAAATPVCSGLSQLNPAGINGVLGVTGGKVVGFCVFDENGNKNNTDHLKVALNYFGLDAAAKNAILAETRLDVPGGSNWTGTQYADALAGSETALFGDIYVSFHTGNGGAGVWDKNTVFFHIQSTSDDGVTGLLPLTVNGGGLSGASLYASGTRPVAPAPVPEPATWVMMLAGFGLVGLGLRDRRARPATVTA